MSQISDVGVNFKMTGANEFESRLKALESQWKSFSGSMDKSPAMNHHFEKMSAAAERAGNRISSAMKATKLAIAGVLAAKAGSGLFNWALGDKSVAEAKSYASQFIDKKEMPEYEAAMSRIRDKHEVDKADLYMGAYQTDSAMAGKPLEDKLRVFEQIIYYAKLTGKSFVEAAKLYKQFLSSFGNALPANKQKTFAEDTLGMLYKIGKLSSSDPQQVADAVGQLGMSRMNKGLSQAHMFAEIAALTPALGNKPDVAATALRSVYPRVGTAAQKLVEAFYEQQYATGQTIDRLGRYSRNWGSLHNLMSAAEDGDKQAKQDLANMNQWKREPGRVAAEQAEQFIKNKDPHGLWQYLGKLIEQNKGNPQAMKVMADAFGLEHQSAVETLINQYQRGEIKRLEDEFARAKGSEAKDARHEADSTNLPHKMSLVTQKAQDFSTSLRSIFYEPMKALLEEWKFVFQKLDQDFGGQKGVGKLRDAANHAMAGIQEGWSGKAANPAESKLVAQMFQETLDGMGVNDWKSAGMKVGKAASDFVEIMGQLKQIIGSVHSALSYLGILKPLAIAAVTPGPLPLKAAVGFGVGAYDGISKMGFQQGGPLDERGLLYPTPLEPRPAPELTVPAHRSNQMIVPPDQMQTAHTPGGPVQGQFSGTLESNVTVNIDGEQVANAVAPKLYDKIKGIVEGLIGSGSRDTATGAMLK